VISSDFVSGYLGGKSAWRIQVLSPVLVVVVLWLIMSIGTTIYLQWVETFYNRVFSENLTSIGAAHSVESLVWKTLAEWDDSSQNNEKLQLEWKEREATLRSFTFRADGSQQSAEEKAAEKSLRLAIDELCSATQTELNISRTTGARDDASRRRIQELTEAVSGNAARLRKVNEELIAQSRDWLAATHSQVVAMRMSMLILGPLLGIFLGWRVALRLQSSVTEIAVTLNESALLEESHGMRVSITKHSSFEDVRRQAERVVERLKEVGLELQSARREVIQSERLAAVGELAAGVAHELRNPLTSVKLLLQHASRQSSEFRIGQSQLKLILDEVRRMESTIQGLLDFSRTPALHRIRHDLRETLQRSINLVDARLQQQHLELQTHISQNTLLVDGDAEQLNQVFVNLLLNSIEATANGGLLSVTAEPSTDHSLARVIVRDNGTGISPEVMTRLFEPFATTKERGTGLGLAISRRIVTEHRGTIAAKNLPGHGAEFTVELPLCPRPTK